MLSAFVNYCLLPKSRRRASFVFTGPFLGPPRIEWGDLKNVNDLFIYPDILERSSGWDSRQEQTLEIPIVQQKLDRRFGVWAQVGGREKRKLGAPKGTNKKCPRTFGFEFH